MLNRSVMQMLDRMISPPPPMPWITRPAKSMLTLILRAHIRDPTKNTMFARSIIGFRPKISLNFPQIGVDAVIRQSCKLAHV